MQVTIMVHWILVEMSKRIIKFSISRVGTKEHALGIDKLGFSTTNDVHYNISIKIYQLKIWSNNTHQNWNLLTILNIIINMIGQTYRTI